MPHNKQRTTMIKIFEEYGQQNRYATNRRPEERPGMGMMQIIGA